MKQFYPEKFNVDYEGKHQEYEGVALLSFIDTSAIEKEYLKLCIEQKELPYGYAKIFTVDKDYLSTYISFTGDILEAINVKTEWKKVY